MWVVGVEFEVGLGIVEVLLGVLAGSGRIGWVGVRGVGSWLVICGKGVFLEVAVYEYGNWSEGVFNRLP